MTLGENPILKRVLVGVACSALLGAAIWLGLDWLRHQRTRARAVAHLEEVLSLLNLAAMRDFHQRLDTVRAFVNDNSIHKIDGAFQANRANPHYFLAGLLANAKGTSSEPVHMECSTRTGVMKGILKALGYETRVIAIFNSRTNLKSHSFLEVMNPDTERWETQDADYDIYWRSKRSGKRISLADSAEYVDDIEPCSQSDCGWSASREGIRAKKLFDYLDIISVTAKEKAVRFALYTSRADLSRTYSKGRKHGAFCEVEAKRCKRGFYDISKYSSYEPGLPR